MFSWIRFVLLCILRVTPSAILQELKIIRKSTICFRALVDGELQEKGSDIKAKLYDANNKLGLDVGLAALMQDNGIKVSLTDTHPILGYKKFKANADNYLMLSDDQRVSANLLLTASGGMGVRVYSNDEMRTHCRILQSV